MKYNIIFSLGLIFFVVHLKGQVNFSDLPLSVKFDGSAPHASALLEVTSFQKGFQLAPAAAQTIQRMDGLPEGAMYFDTVGCLHVYKSSGWRIDCSLHAESFANPSAPGQIPVQNADGSYLWKSLTQLQKESINYHQRGFQATSKNTHPVQLTGTIPLLSADWNGDKTFMPSTASSPDHQYVVIESGHYYLTSTISFKDGNGVDDSVFMRFEVNDQPTHIESLIDPKYFANGGYQSQSLSGILYLNVSDVVHLQLTDVNQSISIEDRSFSAQKISN